MNKVSIKIKAKHGVAAKIHQAEMVFNGRFGEFYDIDFDNCKSLFVITVYQKDADWWTTWFDDYEIEPIGDEG
jgi:hypothetical protein